MKTPAELAATIDHTLLRPEATPDRIDTLCEQAIRYGFAGVCVNPIYVRRAAEYLHAHAGKASAQSNPQEAGGEAGTRTRKPSPSNGGRLPAVISVAGFPLGANLAVTKEEEAQRCIEDGATEIDMVMHIGAMICGDLKTVRAEIERVAMVVHGIKGGILKVILETAVLTPEQMIAACRCCAEGEADFVKTSTGLHPEGGATLEHVRLLHRHAAPLRVKASGGIRTTAEALAMIQAGASRIGTSSGVTIIEELLAKLG